MNEVNAYLLAQTGIAHLKSAVHSILLNAGAKGLRNVDIGLALGIYSGHKGHQGHIPRTILAIMETEGTVRQDEDKRWHLVDLETHGFELEKPGK